KGQRAEQSGEVRSRQNNQRDEESSGKECIGGDQSHSRQQAEDRRSFARDKDCETDRRNIKEVKSRAEARSRPCFFGQLPDQSRYAQVEDEPQKPVELY